MVPWKSLGIISEYLLSLKYNVTVWLKPCQIYRYIFIDKCYHFSKIHILHIMTNHEVGDNRKKILAVLIFVYWWSFFIRGREIGMNIFFSSFCRWLLERWLKCCLGAQDTLVTVAYLATVQDKSSRLWCQKYLDHFSDALGLHSCPCRYSV